MFEFFEHTADAGFRVVAADRAGLFREAAEALFSLVVEDLHNVEPVEHRHLALEGTDDEYLLFDWLNELLYLHATEGLVFREFEVRLTEEGLEADAAGERLDRQRHRPLHEVKAITYHALEVRESEEGWRANVIVDI